MARPLSTPDHYRGGNGSYTPRYSLDDSPTLSPAALEELEHLRAENAQLRTLCGELEQALHEAAQQPVEPSSHDDRLREYEQLIDEKTQTICQLHQQLQELQALYEEAAGNPAARQRGPMPREDELLTLSEDLERERRQLQEDEQALMEQMRQMEMSMARERAEMARQRNDLQRLYGEIRHELERLERNGALQTKMDELKAKLQDASTRRGASPNNGAGRSPASSSVLPDVNPHGQASPAQGQSPASRGSFMGRFFGGNK